MAERAHMCVMKKCLVGFQLCLVSQERNKIIQKKQTGTYGSLLLDQTANCVNHFKSYTAHE